MEPLSLLAETVEELFQGWVAFSLMSHDSRVDVEPQKEAPCASRSVDLSHYAEKNDDG